MLRQSGEAGATSCTGAQDDAQLGSKHAQSRLVLNAHSRARLERVWLHEPGLRRWRLVRPFPLCASCRP